MAYRFDQIPAALQEQARWLTWRHKEGRKPPCDGQGNVREGWKERLLPLALAISQLNALPFPVMPAAGGHPNAGIGLADATGVDCDDAFLPDGTVDPRAQVVLDTVPGYAERSPSGKGFKIFCRVDPPRWLELNFKEDGTPKPAVKEPNYFAVTGDVLREGDPNADGTAALAKIEATWKPEAAGQGADRPDTKLADQVPAGSQEQAMFREASRLRRLGWKEAEIAGSLWTLVQNGRFPNETGREPWTYSDCQEKARSVCKYKPGTADDFARDKSGSPKKIVENVRLALAKLGCEFRHDTFSDERFVTRDGETRRLNDSLITALRFEAEETFDVRVSKDLFFDVVHHEADSNPFHPVCDYLAGLTWDGTPRIDKWLTTYGQAESTPFTDAVGALVLTAAVRRVREPGCKFDEILILESEQGFDKSNALAALCPNQAWFSDSLPLGADSKVVVERTQGIWIVEASELQGYGRKEVDHLKGFLSCRVDGPVRLAYAREPVKVPRQFIVVGTTNLDNYLKDSTGNRRFWPVTVGRFDVERLRRDRDQLWAEAAAREATPGTSIRLDKSLWDAAGTEQERRELEHPWTALLEKALVAKDCWIRSDTVWLLLRVPSDRQNVAGAMDMSKTMKALGFKQHRTVLDGRRHRVWGRGKYAERPGVTGLDPADEVKETFA